MFEGTNLKQEQSSLNNSDLTYTQRNGKQYFQPLGAQRAGEKGPLLLQDVHLVDTLASFNRERVPERIVHARGAGAHGFFEATTDYAEKLSAADVFKKGTRTSVTVRFSTVGGARGSADQARDPRGVAIKFRTKQGILDWVVSTTYITTTGCTQLLIMVDDCSSTTLRSFSLEILRSSHGSFIRRRPTQQPMFVTGTLSGRGPLNSQNLCCSF